MVQRGVVPGGRVPGGRVPGGAMPGGRPERRSTGVGSRPVAAAGAAAALLVGLVLAATAVVGGGVTGVDRPTPWLLVCCVLGAGAERALLGAVRRHPGATAAVAVVGLIAALAGGATAWAGAAGVLAASAAMTFVPVAVAAAFTPSLEPRSARDVRDRSGAWAGTWRAESGEWAGVGPAGPSSAWGWWAGWAPVVVFRVLAALGLLLVVPATVNTVGALWCIVGAGIATALTVSVVRAGRSRGSAVPGGSRGSAVPGGSRGSA
jgi:hypothetical protein